MSEATLMTWDVKKCRKTQQQQIENKSGARDNTPRNESWALRSHRKEVQSGVLYAKL